jgi:hypothetical protein
MPPKKQKHARLVLHAPRGKSLEIRVPGREWWYYAAFIQQQWPRHPLDNAPGNTRLRAVFTLGSTDCQINSKGGRVIVAGEENETVISLDIDLDYEELWQGVIKKLETFAATASRYLSNSMNLTPDEAIERYYRIRSQGNKITLGAIAEMTGYTESYLRKRKVEYDRRGGWGSKKSEPEKTLP